MGSQCPLQDAIGGYILECTEYLHHILMCFVIQVMSFPGQNLPRRGGTMGVALDNWGTLAK